MIRPTIPADTPVLMDLAEKTGVFKPHEIEALKEVLDDYHAHNAVHGHCCVTREGHGQIAGFAYYAPAAMTDRSWYLYWIAVSKTVQAKGLGSELLKYVEKDIQEKNGRVLFLETSGLPIYELTRKFYLRNGYDQEATLRDYYAAGDDMVVFRKSLVVSQ